ncbi:MAG: hypothetical protein AAGK28_16935, partial [Pseudomonadota bacterium]
GGTVVLLGTGEVTYTPDPAITGDSVDTFTYTVSTPDGAGGTVTETATVTVNVTNTNDAPVAQDDVASGVEDGPAVTGNVITDPVTGDPLPFDPDTPFVPPVDDQNYIPEQSQTNLGTPIEDGTAVPPLDLTPYFGDPDAPDGVTLSIVPTDLPEGLTFDPVTNQITG